MAELTPHEIDELRISIQKYFDVRQAALEKQIDTADRLNAFRFEALGKEYESLCDQIRELQEFKTTVNAKADQRQVNIALILALLGLLLDVIWVVKAFVK